MKRFLSLTVLFAFHLWVSLAAQAWAAAAFDEKAVADFYRGKSVRIIVGFSAGEDTMRIPASSGAISTSTFREIPASSSTTWREREALSPPTTCTMRRQRTAR